MQFLKTDINAKVKGYIDYNLVGRSDNNNRRSWSTASRDDQRVCGQRFAGNATCKVGSQQKTRLYSYSTLLKIFFFFLCALFSLTAGKMVQHAFFKKHPCSGPCVESVVSRLQVWEGIRSWISEPRISSRKFLDSKPAVGS